VRLRVFRYLDARPRENSESRFPSHGPKIRNDVRTHCALACCRNLPTDAWMGASVSFSFAMVMAFEKRDLCVAVNETFREPETRSLDDAFGNLPLHVQGQVCAKGVALAGRREKRKGPKGALRSLEALGYPTLGEDLQRRRQGLLSPARGTCRRVPKASPESMLTRVACCGKCHAA
jgi:hypothetical protein